MTSEEVAAALISYIKVLAEKTIDMPINKAVISALEKADPMEILGTQWFKIGMVRSHYVVVSLWMVRLITLALILHVICFSSYNIGNFSEIEFRH